MSSSGIVKPQTYMLEKELILDSGKKLKNIDITYETYGALNKKKDNAVLVLHALSGDAHCAGLHKKSDKHPGWWDAMIGKGKAIDTDKYFVICSNVIGGCKGSTGPSSIEPETNKSYGLSFPVITISDMVRVQKKLIEFLGIEKLHNVIGGSMGGMQVLEWMTKYPEMTASAVVIGSTSRLSAQGIAFNVVGRNAIMSDANWNNGDYYETKAPDNGLAIARMIGHITYLSDKAMHNKFGRRLQNSEKYGYDFKTEFQVESYLKYQGDRFVERFDANTYLYLTRAMDYFDLAGKYGSLSQAFSSVTANVLVISFTSDWLFPTYQSKEIVSTLMSLDKKVSFCEINSPCGHDAFLLEYEELTDLVFNFLGNI
jgi:homoserine O-acetyltransferase/O-succinyltransferase